MKKSLLPFLFTMLLLSSCQDNEQQETNTTTPDNSEPQTEDVIVDDPYTTTDEEAVEYKGFIGNSPITAYLTYDENQGSFSGYYFYDKYEKKISLQGGETDWYGGPVYGLEETNENGEITGNWVFMMHDYFGSFTAMFESPDGETSLDIIIKNTSTEGYLHPDSKMLFQSKSTADDFFDQNHFEKNTTKRRGGFIVHEPSEEEYMSGPVLLPVGIAVYEHDGGDGFSVEKVGIVTESNIVQYDNGDEIGLYDWESPTLMEIDYEFQVLRFNEVITPEYIFVMLKDQGFYLSIAELNKHGYHLEGDGYWYKLNSNQVMGYYPYETVTIYEDKDVESKSLLSISDDYEGFFAVEDVINFNNEVWAKVTFDYFTEVPCEGTIREPKPSVSGWIPFYSGSYKDELRLGFYSRGC